VLGWGRESNGTIDRHGGWALPVISVPVKVRRKVWVFWEKDLQGKKERIAWERERKKWP
jgi:hypothetical protein